jgi:hypothetical protein
MLGHSKNKTKELMFRQLSMSLQRASQRHKHIFANTIIETASMPSSPKQHHLPGHGIQNIIIHSRQHRLLLWRCAFR